MITGQQIRAARELVGWSTLQLARAARLPFNTVLRAETLGHEPLRTVVHADAIRQALEAAGGEFGQDIGVKRRALP